MTPSVDPSTRYIKLDPRDFGGSRFALRLWHGMTLGAFLRMMSGNWRHVSRERYGLVASVLTLSLGNSVLKTASQAIYGRRIAATVIAPDPVFIIGYWRSGTTWLNQLMACDPRLASPTGAQVFMPETFLVTGAVIRPAVHRLIRGKRPMDNVEVSMKSVEEDEIALANAGAPSLFHHVAFPECDPPGGLLYPQDMTPEARKVWVRIWLRFLRTLQMVNPGKRLLLKSPGHTVRLAEIMDLFPNARFIHIARDPYRIVMSSLRSGRSLTASQSFYTGPIDLDRMRQKELARFRRFHACYDTLKPLIPPGQLAEIRYEDLRRDPVSVLCGVYDRLDLGDFAPLEPRLAALVAAQEGYSTNRFDMAEEEEAAIWEGCRAYFDRYGYRRLSQRQEAAG